VLCGSSPHTEYKIYGASLSGFSFRVFYSKVSYRKAGISVPICLRHYFVMLFVRSFMFISCAAMILFGIPVLLSLIESSLFPGISAIYFILFFVSLAVFIISTKWQPIKVKDVGQHFFTLYIRSNRYADEFASVNQL
jgi:hypothetical protein